MSVRQPRLSLTIDVFSLKRLPASALLTITPPELIAAILDEFAGQNDAAATAAAQVQGIDPKQYLKLEFLSDTPADYRLLHLDTGLPVNISCPLGQQLKPNDHLVLDEHEVLLPEGTSQPSTPAYLRELGKGRVFRLAWMPAIIGRPDRNQPHNDRIAADLAAHPTGQRVSRRHARITEANGTFYVEALSPNPTLVKHDQSALTVVGEKGHELHDGDIILLERSAIELKFILRPKVTP